MKRLPVPTLAELREVRQRYHGVIRAHFVGHGKRFQDKAISAPAARFIIRTLSDRGAQTVLDMGMGYSTVTIGFWLSRSKLAYWGADHDKAWVRLIVDGVFKELEPPKHIMEFSTCDQLFVQAERLSGSFDAVIVDHGPTAQARLADIPRLAELVADGGIMFFDDWRSEFGKEISKMLAKSKGDWTIDVAEETKRNAKDKAIAWAVRT